MLIDCGRKSNNEFLKSTFTIFTQMRKVKKYIFYLILSIGLILIVTGRSVLFSNHLNDDFRKIAHLPESPIDAEHSASCDFQDDVFIEDFDFELQRTSIASYKYPLIEDTILTSYYSSIWQPPKFI